MATSKKDSKEPTKTIAWFPPYTDDSIDFRNACGVEVVEGEDSPYILYRPGSHEAPRSIRATGRTVSPPLPEVIADNYLTHPTMIFREVPAETDAAEVNPQIARIASTLEPPPPIPVGTVDASGAFVTGEGEGEGTGGTDKP